MYKSDKLERMFNGVETPTFIICEIGINHNGDINQAIKLIESAKKLGSMLLNFKREV